MLDAACEGPGFADDFDPRRGRGVGMRPIAAPAEGTDPIRVERAAPHAGVVVAPAPG